jgi:hypothetical protein
MIVRASMTESDFFQFQKEFTRLQPSANDFFLSWEQLASTVISFSETKRDNGEVASLLDEMYSGGQGQANEAGYKPPQCMSVKIYLV